VGVHIHMWTPHLKKWGVNWPPGTRGSVAPDHGHGPSWRMDNNSWWAEDFSTSRETQFVPNPPAFGTQLGGPHKDFVKIFCVIKLESLGYCAALFLWPYVQPFWYNTGLWQTDRQIQSHRHTMLAKHCAGKNGRQRQRLRYYAVKVC